MTQPTPADTPRLGPIDHARTASAERQQHHDGGPATAEQLLNLADRTPHGLTPDETTRLRQGVAHHCARAEKAEAQRDQYASAIRELIVQVKHTAYVWATTLPDTIPTAEVTRALSFLCSPIPLPENLRDDTWQRIVGAYYLRFENDGHPEDATVAADLAMAIIRSELEQHEAAIERVREFAAELERAGWTQAAIARRLRAALDEHQEQT